nr:hypothetical protein TRHOD_g10 [Trichoderma rhododendri]
MMSSGFAGQSQADFLLVRDVQPKLFVVFMVALAIISSLMQWFYNLYLPPKRKIPGPRLSAMTSLYEVWFDIIRDGKYPEEIKRMHEVYGSVVRISPREIHVQESKHRGIMHTHEIDPYLDDECAAAFTISSCPNEEVIIMSFRAGNYFTKAQLGAPLARLSSSGMLRRAHLPRVATYEVLI